jgi:hypothetical protein
VHGESEVGLLRLVAQRVAGPREPDAAAAVRRLTAVQGQVLPGALTSVALRTATGCRADVVAAVDGGAVVRSWPMRGTLHLLAAEDLGWLLDLLAPRMLAGAAGRRRQLGLTEADTERARDVAVAVLAGGRRASRGELLAALADGGVDTGGQRGYHLLCHLSQTGTTVLGPTDGRGDQQFVLLAEWVPAPRRPTREEALAELALRYLASHGPATVADLARWAGIGVRDARAGVAAAGDRLAELDVDGVRYLLDPAVPDLLAAHRAEASGVHLLPGFDEFVLGYASRDPVLSGADFPRIVPGGNGVFRNTVVAGGRVVGTWSRPPRGGDVLVEPFGDLPDAVAAGAREAAARLP